MKKILTILTITIFSITSSFALDTTLDLSGLEDSFKDMGEELGSAVASSATTGLVWSDAYVGGFPHFGIGVFSGAQVISLDAFTDLLDFVDPSASLPSELTDLGVGIPIPAFGIDGRIGGFILPFDIGVKFALLNDLDFSGVSFDYSLIGADIRYALIKGGLVLPKISVGVGYSRLTTEIGVSGILDGDYEILPATTYTDAVVLTNPDLVYGWESNVIEFKAQASKNLIFVTPAIGFNAAYSMTTIGGGLSTSVTNGTETLTQEQIDDAIAAAGADYDIDADGFESYSETTAWSFKINAGASFNVALLKIDVSANYEIISESYGGQIGFRLQL